MDIEELKKEQEVLAGLYRLNLARQMKYYYYLFDSKDIICGATIEFLHKDNRYRGVIEEIHYCGWATPAYMTIVVEGMSRKLMLDEKDWNSIIVIKN